MGRCKYINEECGINPRYLLEYGGLREFWNVFSLAVGVSPLDGDSLPSVLLITEIAKEFDTGLSGQDFWTCTQIAIREIRKRATRERKNRIEKLKQKNKRRGYR